MQTGSLEVQCTQTGLYSCDYCTGQVRQTNNIQNSEKYVSKYRHLYFKIQTTKTQNLGWVIRVQCRQTESSSCDYSSTANPTATPRAWEDPRATKPQLFSFIFTAPTYNNNQSPNFNYIQSVLSLEIVKILNFMRNTESF